MADPSLVRFRAVVQRSLAELEARRDEVNDLNVFPVADGDTGDNMALTLRAVLDELDRLSEKGELDAIDRDEIVEGVARAALLGARGNSGVILSQLIRGAAEELASRPGELVDPVLIGAAMARAADRAYDSVREPAEGTILTVVREMAHRVAFELPHMDQARLSQEEVGRQDLLIAEVLERALDAGQQSVRRGPDLLPVLREAGVVDAGGFGLTVIFAGVIAALRGAEAPELDHHAPARVTHPQHESSTYRYCTNFAVTGQDLDAERLDRAAGGDRRLGARRRRPADAQGPRPHGPPGPRHRRCSTARAASRGSTSPTCTSRSSSATERLSEPTAVCGVVAVVAGRGMEELFTALGATPLPGGPTLNPSTYELLAGIHDVPAEEVVVLPNSPNVLMAAERAAELSDKKVVVVPTRSQQAGLAAAVALDAGRGAEANGAAMLTALEPVRTGAVTEAARDDAEGRPARFHRGDAVGFIDERIVAWGEPAETLEAVLGELGARRSCSR